MHKLLILLKILAIMSCYGALFSLTTTGFLSMENLIWWLATFVFTWAVLMGTALSESEVSEGSPRELIQWHLEDAIEELMAEPVLEIEFEDEDDLDWY